MYEEKEVIMFNRYDSEKQELYDRIRELETMCEDFEAAKAKIQ